MCTEHCQCPRVQIGPLGVPVCTTHLLLMPGTTATELKRLPMLSKLTHLSFFENVMIDDLRGVHHMPSVRYLTFKDAVLNDLRGIEAFPNVTTLILDYTSVSDIAPLGALQILGELHLNHTKVEDLEGIKSLRCLRLLSLKGTPILDLNPIVDSGIERVDLKSTAITARIARIFTKASGTRVNL